MSNTLTPTAPRRPPPPRWLDEPGLTVSLAEVRDSIAFETGLAEAEAKPEPKPKPGRSNPR